MMFIDLNNGAVLTVPYLFQEWQQFKTEDPYNHEPTFKRELFNIIDATLRGRNDLEIIGLTRTELFNLYNKLIMEV